MKSFYYLSICFCLLFNTSRNYSQCYYVVDMQDSFGDGWNGASLDVSINGTLVSSLTFANGGNFTDSVFTLNGDFVEFYFSSGNWDTEITYQIYDPLSNQIGSYGPYPNNQGNSRILQMARNLA